MTTNLSTIEAAVAERAKADRRRLAAARAKADEDLGARLRALIAPTATRAEQVAKASQWLDEQRARRASRESEHTEPEHSEGEGEHYPA